MPIGHVALAVLLLWSLLHGLKRILNRAPRHTILPWNLNKTSTFNSIQIYLRHVHLQIQTTACNTLHDRFIHFLTSRRNKKYKIWLSSFYKIGYHCALLGMVGATAILCWTCWLMLCKISNRSSFTTTTHLNKRNGLQSMPQSQDWPTITPVIPGITVPLSDMPIIICAVFVSQMIHELGHAMSAAIENVSIESIGASLTLIVPSASVAFTSRTFDGLSSRSRSVIASAGPFHNLVFWLVLALVARTNLTQYFWQFAYQDITNCGRIIISVSHDSALRGYLYPGTVLTHINDVPLNSVGVMDDMWGVLRYYQADDAPGWCVNQVELTRSQSCCFREMSDVSPLSCFREESSSAYGCLDPLPLLTSSNSSARCNRNLPCSSPFICTHPDEHEQLWRLTIRHPRDEQSIILWSGSLEEVQTAVKLGIFKPRLLIFPLSLPLLLTTYFRYLSLATLSLFFFNLLPVHRLDGHHLLKIVLGTGTSEEDWSDEYDMEANSAASRHPRWVSRAAQLLSIWLPRLTLGALALSLVLTLLNAG